MNEKRRRGSLKTNLLSIIALLLLTVFGGHEILTDRDVEDTGRQTTIQVEQQAQSGTADTIQSEQQAQSGTIDTTQPGSTVAASYTFRSEKLREEHYEKHGIEMGFTDAASYETAASQVITNPNSLHKTEQEDGDDIYYLEATNEFVILSKDGYIRTYYLPTNGIDYYNRK